MESFLALLLDGNGRGHPLDREGLRRWRPEHGGLWILLRPDSADGERWLAEESGLPAGDRETLLRPVTQTRVEIVERGELMLALRSFEPESGELLQLRSRVRADRIISVTPDALPAFEACRRLLEHGLGPRTVSDIVLTAVRVAGDKDQTAVYELDERVAELELSEERARGIPIDELREARQRATALRRRLAAQREALAALKLRGPDWLVGGHPDLWRDALTSAGELVDLVDAIIERVRGVQDDAQNELSKALNDRLYRLTILSAIMLPLSFITDLLGVNVGGIPARESPWAFAGLCVLLVGIATGEYLLLRRLHWVPSSLTRRM
jgi:zinc transporter